MNYDEFAFFNRQLAAMLREGLPLEGSLRQLSAGMKDRAAREEIDALERDLAGGTTLKEAMARRRLPELYRRMLEAAAQSNNLPGVLTLLADYYERAGTSWNRLKGLMVYPALVLVLSVILTSGLAFLLNRVFREFATETGLPMAFSAAWMWAPPAVMAFGVGLLVAAYWVRGWRQRLQWKLPAFREARLAQLASMMALMLRSGTSFPSALSLAALMEAGTPAGLALDGWRQRVEAGSGRPEDWPPSMPPFPPLFLWLVRKGGEDPAAGFEKAAALYQARAAYKTDLLLYGALPVSVLFLGQMVIWEALPLFRGLTSLMNALGGMQ